jgi:deazaflavin-dependent oxidoreductase (nitroreductase family)
MRIHQWTGMVDDFKQGVLSQRPRRWLRVFLKAPILLYRLHLGWLLGQRFLLLEHMGRKSGLTRRTVIEVVNHDPITKTWTVAAAFGGRTAHWFQNIQERPAVIVTVGIKRSSALARPLDEDQGDSIFRDYAKQNARAWALLYRLILGDRFDGSDAAFRRFAAQVPAVAFHTTK